MKRNPTLLDRTNLQHEWLLDGDGTDTAGSIDLTATNITWNVGDVGYLSETATGNGSTSVLYNNTAQTLGIANAWTISFWFNPANDTTLQVLNELRNHSTDTNNMVQLRKEATTENFRILLYNSSGTNFKDYTSSSALTQSEWQYIVVTWDGTNLKYYKDLVEDTSMTKTTDSAGTMTDTSRKVTWGNDRATTGTNEYNGDLQICRLDSVVLTDEEMLARYQEGLRLLGPSDLIPSIDRTDLVGSYEGDFSGTTTWYDASGNNNGTLTNNPEIYKQGLTNVCHFDRASSEDCDTGLNASSYTAWSTSFWFNNDGAGTASSIYEIMNDRAGGGSATAIAIFKDASGGSFGDVWAFNIRSVTTQTSAITKAVSYFPVGEWVHIVVTYNGSTVQLYKNGVADGNYSLTGAFGTTANIHLGGNAAIAGRHIDGRLGLVRFYDVAITQDDVDELYVEGQRRLFFPKYSLPSIGNADIPLVTDGLVSDLPLNGHAEDTSGEGNNGTATNITYNTKGNREVGEFNGTTSGVDIANDTVTNNLSAFTVSGWINTDSTASNQMPWSKNWKWFRITSSGTIQANVAQATTNANYITTNTVSTDTWYHLLFTYDGTDIAIYLDGVECSYSTSTSGVGAVTADSTKNWLLGRYDIGEYFDGEISGFKIFNRVLSQTEIGKLYSEGDFKLNQSATGPYTVISGNLVGEYLLNSNGDDTSGNANNGTENGMDWRLAAQGEVGKFDATTSHIDVPDLNLDAGDFSVSIFFKSDTSDNLRQQLVSIHDAGAFSNKLEFYLGNDGENDGLTAVFRDGAAGEAKLNDTTDLKDGKWHHAVVTRTGTSAEIFLDGVSVDTATDAEIGVTLGAKYDIGAYDYSGTLYNEFPGELALCRFYDDILTDNEIEVLYSEGLNYINGIGARDGKILDISEAAVSSTYYDQSGYGNNGTPTSITETQVGLNTLMEFNGTTSKIDCGSDTSIDNIFDGGGTFSVWYNADGLGENSAGRFYDKTDLFYIASNSGRNVINFQKYFSSTNGNWQFPTGSGSLSFGEWHHLTVTYDSSSTSNNPIIYLDGVSQSLTETSTPAGTPSSNAGVNMIIGNRSANDRTFDGKLSNPQFYNRILSPEEVQQLYYSNFIPN